MAQLRRPAAFRAYVAGLGISLPIDEEVLPAPNAPLAQPYTLKNGRRIGNRFCVLPMEGWDGTPDGLPTDNTLRCWANFGRSGAKLIWGGEAIAVCHAGRANPNQLTIEPHTLSGLDQLRRTLLQTHAENFGSVDDLLQSLGIELVNLTAGSPYYCPHIQRPAAFPPSDGYEPLEDPLISVARLVNHTAALKARFPNLAITGMGYSYLQEWLPHVAQYAVRAGMTDFAGLGRMILSYPQMPADVLAGRRLDRNHICRTFSDCTTGPRMGLVSGCYPLDAHYKQSPEAEVLKQAKAQARSESRGSR